MNPLANEENNNQENQFRDLKNAIIFLNTNKGIRPQDVDKKKLKDAVDFIFKFSVTNGLSSDLINTLCNNIIFCDAFDTLTRRKLLYSCVPESTEFPYQIIPLAISCASLPEASSTWQYTILMWLSGLLEYHVVEESNKYIHICYTSLFRMLDNIRLCGVICKILYQITKLEDVNSFRTKILLKLERKNGFASCVSRLIRIYKFFRPDLIVSRFDIMGQFPSVPKSHQESLLNAKARIDESTDRAHLDQDLWPTFAMKKRRLNPYSESDVILQPEILLYSENIEEKKAKKISVLQYKRLKDMIKDLPYWKDWKWPNSSPMLLKMPILIPLFKPHDPYVKVAITNWLELALRTEVIEQLGNPNISRQENLLNTCIALVKQSETIVPAVFHFLVEFFAQWDNYSHINKVLDLLCFFPFISPTVFFESVFEKISLILTTASLPLFCAFINALGSMVTTWALQAQEERDHYRNAADWPFSVGDTSPLEGIFYLTQRLERVLLGGVIRFGPHSMLLNTSIAYYSKVNMCCEYLALPLFVSPPVELLFVILASADIVATHHIGLVLSRVPERIKFLKDFKGKNDEKLMCSVSLSAVDRINFSVLVFLDSTVSTLAFSDRWLTLRGNYVGNSFYEELKSMKRSNSFGYIGCALPYLPFSLEYHRQSRNFLQDKEQKHIVTNEILSKLNELKLSGIHTCAKTYIKSK